MVVQDLAMSLLTRFEVDHTVYSTEYWKWLSTGSLTFYIEFSVDLLIGPFKSLVQYCTVGLTV